MAAGRSSSKVPRFGDSGWEPNTSVELSDISSLQGARASRIRDDYFRTAINQGEKLTGIAGSSGSLYDRMLAGRLITQFWPPNFTEPNDVVGSKLASRRLLHGWDLGKWFTQPTLIITGVLEADGDGEAADSMPTPVWVNGQRVPAQGATLVTWIYPFEASPPEFLAARAGDVDSEDQPVDDSDDESE